MTASPGDGEHAAREGYYPDPSIPGYIRYWNGAAWVPGTSRPAPAAPAPVPTPLPAPAPVRPLPAPAPVAAPAVRADETGPVFLDETSMTEALPEPAPAPAPARAPAPAPAAEPAAAQAPVWQADPVHQAGFGGPRDRRVSWGSPQEPEADPAHAPAPAPAHAHAPAPAPSSEPAPAPEPAAAPEPGRPSGRSAGISLARTPSAAPEPARLPAQSSAGILSARSPAAQAPAARAVQAAPAAPAWPDAPGTGGPGPTGVTSAWPEATPAPAPSRTPAPAPSTAPARTPAPAASTGAPAPAPERPAAPAPARPEVWEPRPAGVRPKVPQPVADAAPAEPEPESESKPGGWEPRGSQEARAGARTGRPAATPRAVFERMADRAVRPAGLVRRTLARVLDSLVFGAVAAAVARPLVPGAAAHVQAKVDAARASGRTTTVWLFDSTIAGSLGLVLGAVLLFGVLYEVLPTARWGRTPGKKLLGVRVLATATLRPPSFGAALVRWLVYAFLGLPGSLWCLVNRPRRQGWHDKAAKTYVAR
ncbi:RDD family protein [Streptomyces amritsarensis]|uniref:RDD family protein n=2 Tax=Streptomyces TaxID=1883 RepID=UPI0036B111AB